MNINLSKPTTSQKKPKYGLNKRGANIFEKEESSDEEPPAANARASVNQAIAKEQAALRARAQRAAAAVADDTYDFDGAYDSFSSNQKTSTTLTAAADRKSRYVADLLQASKQRQAEREIVMERKIAREQAAEDPEYQDKDKFVTSAYKRKLQERNVWQAEQEKLEQDEQANDVSKRKDGMAGFYGNLQKNVALGGQQSEQSSKQLPSEQADFVEGFSKSARGDDDNEPQTSTFLDGFAKGETEKDIATESIAAFSKNQKDPKADKEEMRKKQRELREEKVAQARIRYFQRHPVQ
jgi:coiled-coil domain-containing protein 55